MSQCVVSPIPTPPSKPVAVTVSEAWQGLSLHKRAMWAPTRRAERA